MIHTALSRRPSRYQRATNRLRIDQLEQRVLLAADLNFVPLANSAVIAPTNSAIEAKPFTMPSTSYVQTIVERHVAADSLPENNVAQNTLNESGPQPGRYLFTTSSTLTGSLIRTDLYTGETIDLLAIATADGQLDGETLGDHLSLQNLSAVRWTPWGTLLVAEAINGADAGYVEDPDFPNNSAADHGLVYEIVDPTSDAPVVFGRPALGSGVFESIAIDANGQIYLDESVSGAILQFVPGVTDDLSAGTLSALLANAGDTGAANWTEIFVGIENLPHTLVSDPSLYTAYPDPQGMVIGATAQGPTLYVALRGDLSSRILAIDLDSDEFNLGDQAVINVFADDTTIDAQTGLPAGADFAAPGSLALDSKGRLYVGEQQSLIAGDRGNDVWVAVDNDNDGVADKLGRRHSLATRGNVGTVGFGALVTGLYVNPFNDNELYANVSGSASQKDGIFLIESSALPNTGVFPIVVNGQTTLLVTGTNGSDNIIISGDNIVKVKINSTIYSGAPDTTIIVYGQRGNDRITVTGSVIFDIIAYGGQGADVISTVSGNDSLFGGDGNDSLLTGSGFNFASGGLGNDTINGGIDSDILQGDAGNDRINGNAGDDTLLGGDGNDYLFGAAGNDYASGGNGNDNVQGSIGDDFLLGNAGSDYLYGGLGNDVLIGGTGPDRLYGNDGEDLMIGEATAFDNDEAQLYALWDAWAMFLNGDPDRVAILDADFGLSSTPSDGNPDVLDGGLGMDLFYIRLGLDRIVNFRAYEYDEVVYI